MKTQSALPWFGSDSEVAEQLGAMLDHCKHVTIPFCGGLGILPHLKARAVLANDKHEHAINYYRYASGHWGPLAQGLLFDKCRTTLSHPAEMSEALKMLDGKANTLDTAWAFWTVCWVGYKGRGGTKSQGGMPSVRHTAAGGTNASRVRSAADDLREWSKEFERCEWLCEDFRDVMDDGADKIECGYYVDAPWDGPGDGYLHNFTRQDHVDLRDKALRFKQATVLIRYGDTPFIRELYEGWDIIDAESRDQANNMKGELWILNRRGIVV